MNGNLMDTTCSGIVNELNVTCSNQNISDLAGIHYFDSITNLVCYGNLLTTLPSLPNSLTQLYCTYNSLTSLPSLPNSLTDLYCNDNLLTSLPSLPNSLVQLRCFNNSLTSFPSLPNSLTYLYCNNKSLTTLPSLPNSLTQLLCNNNSLTILPSLPNSLTFLSCYTNSLTSLPSLPNSLHTLICGSNTLTSLPSLPSSLYSFNINNNPGILCMPPLLNFTGPASYYNISNTGITCLPNLIQHTGYIAAIDTMPICDVFNTNGCDVYWNVKGKVVKDGDSSCVTTNDSTGIQMVKMNLYDGGSNLIQQVIANWGGEYSFDTQLGNYSTSVDTVNIPYNVLCPTNNNIASNLTAIDSMDYNVDFRLTCKPGFDFGVWNVIHHPNFFPGNINQVHVIAGDITQSIYNVSCSSGISGEVKVVINGLADYVSPISGALTPSVNGDTLIYTIADFSLVNSATDFAFNVITDTTAQGGNQICFDVTVTPTTGDNNISNNTLTHCFAVTNSFDPNEKEVSPVGSLEFPINDWLTYTIHFQNTGTAAAQHIQLLDTLDADLDASTFQLLSYSHTPMVQLFGSKVHFNFVNINLVDSTTDAEASKGYVSYRIKPQANLPLGTTIENTASIYFDFNAPVVTNTVSNVICNPIIPTNISYSMCSGASYFFNGVYLTSAGNYTAIYNSVIGCDSVVQLFLLVNGVNMSVNQSNDTLTALTSGTVQWYDCNTQQIIPGATQTVFIPTTSGMYAGIITEGNCSDTTACTQVFTSINEFTINNSQFTISPNPTDENITIQLSQSCNNCQIEISNTLGQILHKQLINDKEESINLSLLHAGIYFVAIRSDKFSAVKKLVKQ